MTQEKRAALVSRSKQPALAGAAAVALAEEAGYDVVDQLLQPPANRRRAKPRRSQRPKASEDLLIPMRRQQ